MIDGRVAESSLEGTDGSERVEDLRVRHTRCRLASGGRVPPERLERRRVNLAVLPDLERGEMESERRQLPPQVLDLPPGAPREAVGDKRLLELGELCVELVGGVVATRERRLLGREVGPRPANPLGDEAEPLAIRFLRESPSEHAVRLG